MSVSRLPALQSPLVLKPKTVGTPNYVFHYHEQCMMTKWAAQHSGAQPHPLRPKIQHLYKNRDRNTLWWRATSHQIPLKKVVRNAVTRRVRTIFREVLYQKGYDPCGRPLVLDKPSPQIPRRTQPVRGYLDIVISKGAVTQEPASMRRELSLLFSRALKGIEVMRKNRDKEGKSKVKGISQLPSAAR